MSVSQDQTPKLAVDGVIFCGEKIVLIKRKNPPFQNNFALPGGFVEIGETVESAISREIFEETNLEINNWNLVGIYSNPVRDPRAHIVSIAFWTEVNDQVLQNLQAGDDAKSTLLTNWQNKSLAFDHQKIISDALNLK